MHLEPGGRHPITRARFILPTSRAKSPYYLCGTAASRHTWRHRGGIPKSTPAAGYANPLPIIPYGA